MIDRIVIDTLYGPSISGAWVPAPRYVLRRARLLDQFSHLVPGRLLEVGCGAGGLLLDLSSRGFECTGVETSEEARAVAVEMVAGSDVLILSDIVSLEEHSFDYLVSCEVLEHVEDDLGTLLSWLKYLKPGGWVFISVPAHEEKFGPLDQWAGHIRRYSRASLEELLERAEVKLKKLDCYGFPLANISAWLGLIKLRDRSLENRSDPGSATARSGIDRSSELRLYGLQRSFLGRVFMRAGLRIQNIFLGSDLGNGFLATGKYEP